MAPVHVRLIALLAFTLLGCGETRYDVFLAGLKAEGEAERGACKLHYDNASSNMMGAATLSGGQIASCLKAHDEALALYEKAKGMGYDDPEFLRVYERARERKDKLTSMLTMVRQMERDAIEAKVRAP